MKPVGMTEKSYDAVMRSPWRSALLRGRPQGEQVFALITPTIRRADALEAVRWRERLVSNGTYLSNRCGRAPKRRRRHHDPRQGLRPRRYERRDFGSGDCAPARRALGGRGVTIWFTSDQHYGHTNIIEYSGRPFSDVHEMNLALTQNYNRVVGNDDTVYHLGDFSLDERSVKINAPFLKGHKILLPGNHDACHPRKHKRIKMIGQYIAWGFQEVYHQPFIKFTGFEDREPMLHRVLLSHCPSSDYEDPRYPEYRPAPADYAVLLHGHVHERWKTKRNEAGSLMVNVGVDQWDYAPVSLETLRELIVKS